MPRIRGGKAPAVPLALSLTASWSLPPCPPIQSTIVKFMVLLECITFDPIIHFQINVPLHLYRFTLFGVIQTDIYTGLYIQSANIRVQTGEP
jgi:hypothetical protein